MYIYETADEIEYELLKANAIKNRQYATQAENLLWLYLKGKQVDISFVDNISSNNTLPTSSTLSINLLLKLMGSIIFMMNRL